MQIKNIEIKNFRNYKDLVVDFNDKVNIIMGKNAQGKTNLIEAVYLTSIGRSFRTSHDNELIKFDENEAYVKALAEKELIDTKVEISINRQSKKFIKKDGKRINKTSQLLKNIIIVIFSPEDLRIVKDEPEKRRKFIDSQLAQIKPAYYNCLESYKKILSQRNVYLKEDKIESSILDVWDIQLIKYGAKLMQLRKEFIDKISEYSSKIHSKISNGTEELVIKYDPNIDYVREIRKQEEIIENVLVASRENDLRQRTTSKGPHKDDIQFYINGVNARKFASQGQQRTCALSLKLAELDFIKEETGENGILLLDDVMSELDSMRREYLIRALRNNQIFITTTDIDEGMAAAYDKAKIIQIENGKII